MTTNPLPSDEKSLIDMCAELVRMGEQLPGDPPCQWCDNGLRCWWHPAGVAIGRIE